MDIALMVDRLRPGAAWLRAKTYEDLQRHWQDSVQTIPTEQELQDEWTVYLTEKIAVDSENDNLKQELTDLVASLSYTNIDTHIDNIFSNLSTEQKNSLKRLYKVVLHIAKNYR